MTTVPSLLWNALPIVFARIRATCVCLTVLSHEPERTRTGVSPGKVVASPSVFTRILFKAEIDGFLAVGTLPGFAAGTVVVVQTIRAIGAVLAWMTTAAIRVVLTVLPNVMFSACTSVGTA